MCLVLINVTGYASVIQVGGIRIGGLSGIYKARDYNRGIIELLLHPFLISLDLKVSGLFVFFVY